MVALGQDKRLGIFGGTFDPPHRGHLQVARHARRQLNLAQVLLVPAGDPPHKQGRAITPAQHRAEMVRLALLNEATLSLSKVDLERVGPHYSVDMIRLVREAHAISADECFFIIGADSLADLPYWHQPHRLLALCKLAVAPRPGYQPDMAALEQRFPRLNQRLVWLEMPPIDLAATTLRQQGRAGGSIEQDVPSLVADYIARHQLYSADD